MQKIELFSSKSLFKKKQQTNIYLDVIYMFYFVI